MSKDKYTDIDYSFIKLALEEAELASLRDEVPIGAVLVDSSDPSVFYRNGNRTREFNDPTAHAEILVIREGCMMAGSQRIPEFDLYVTLEPCIMCAGAISFARVRRLIIGASDMKGGAVLHGPQFFEQPTCHHKPEIVNGIHQAQCSDIMKTFFKRKRKRNKNNKKKRQG